MTTHLPHDESVRERLRAPGESIARRYAAYVIGELKWWRLLKYELLTTLLGPIPGATGLFLRRLFYPLLFAEIGRGVTFGRDVVLRHPGRIRLGDGVVLDDGCLLDGRGAGDEGVVLEDRVVLGRGSYVQSKLGPIRIGRDTVVGTGAIIVAQGGIDIGESVSIAGGCRISGGRFRIPPERGPVEHYTDGPIRIGPRCILTMGATVLDDVTIGEGTLVGAGAIVSSDLPPHSVAAPRPPLVLPAGEARPAFGDGEPPIAAPDGSRPAGPLPGTADSPTLAAVLAAVAEINLQLPPDERLPLSRETVLYGDDGPLDSLRFVNLLVSVEEKVEEAYGAPVSLSDVATGSGDGADAFATVDSLARYVDALRGT